MSSGIEEGYGIEYDFHMLANLRFVDFRKAFLDIGIDIGRPVPFLWKLEIAVEKSILKIKTEVSVTPGPGGLGYPEWS